mgnify:CR=1 FL=1
MSVTNPLLPKQGTLGQSPTVNLPPVRVPGTTTGGTTGGGTGGNAPTIDKIFNFLGNLAGALFPNGLGGSTPPPVYYPSPAPVPAAAGLNLPTIGLIAAVVYLLWKQ